MSSTEAVAYTEIEDAQRRTDPLDDPETEPEARADAPAPRLLIGMVGKARSGKDTFARVLIDAGGYRRAAFADELKDDVAKFLGISVAGMEARKADFRAALQEYGSRMRRERGDDYWIDRLKDAITRRPSHLIGHNVVVTDVRYRNEADWVRSLGGVVVKRVRAGHDGAGEPGGATATHSSETELDAIRPDFVCNCATVPEIQAHALEFLVRPVGDI